jgi:hypothetical protein
LQESIELFVRHALAGKAFQSLAVSTITDVGAVDGGSGSSTIVDVMVVSLVQLGIVSSNLHAPRVYA